MYGIYGVVLVMLLSVAGVGVWLLARRVRREKIRRLMDAPFSEEWEEILVRNMPIYNRLPEELRRRLRGYINVFLAEKRFEGCGGQEITDDVRVTIAAQACLLLVGRNEPKCYPGLYSILVYPHTYVAAGRGDFGGEVPSVRLGESWQSGAVVLTWDSVRGGAFNLHDGQNVTYHEFAHQLDQEDGEADGTPVLDNIGSYKSWAHTFGDGYREFQERIKHHQKTVIDEYGATNPAEYFATATEAFLEKPHQMNSRCPNLYNELKSYYKLDPEQWEAAEPL